MPAGLQVWDEAGNLIIDTSTFMGRLIASIDASAMSGTATVPGLDQGIPFAIPILDVGSGVQTYATVSMPQVTFSGNSVSWTRQTPASGGAPACQLILGVR